MSFRRNLLSMIFLPSLMLVGCGGGDEFSLGNGEGDLSGGGSSNGGTGTGTGGSTGGSSSGTTNVSYLPLSVYVKYSDYVSGVEDNNVFISEASYPLVGGYLINPVNSATLAPVSNATVDDFNMTVNDIEIDPTESFPMLQKVIGNPVSLRTALVFDTTGSTSQVDLDALKLEAKSYISKAQSHTNSVIKNQEFVVWSFGQADPAIEDVTDLTSGFTQDSVDLENAIDSLVLRPSAASSLHKAIVKVIGGYQDSSATPAIDYANDGDNDLKDVITSNGILIHQLVIFSSGPDTKGGFTQEQMTQAIESQGLLQYSGSSTSVVTDFSKKPVFYYVMGSSSNGVVYTALRDVAEKTTQVRLSSGAYSFSDDLIANQIAAIDARIDLDNQYVYRYAFLPREGDNTRRFESKSSGYNYTLEGETNFSLPIALGTPYYELESSVEITGPNGEYIAGAETGLSGEYITGGHASLSEVNTFRAVTRWTDETYSSASYAWTLTSGTGAVNVSDGSFTVASISGASATLQVENTETGQIAFITLEN